MDPFIFVTDGIKQDWSQDGTGLLSPISIWTPSYWSLPAVCGHLMQPPTQDRLSGSQVLRAVCIWVLNISKGGAITALIVKLFFHMFKWSFMHYSLFSLPLAKVLKP